MYYLHYAQKCRINHPRNWIIGHLNTNNIPNKFDAVECMLNEDLLDILAISEFKLDDLFPSSQFSVTDFSTYRNRHEAQSFVTNSPAPWPKVPPLSAGAREVRKLRHVTSVGKLKCFTVQLVLVQQPAKSTIANHHRQIYAQLYSASFICLIWQQFHSESDLDALWMIVYCKFRDSKRYWQRYSAATDLFVWLVAS